MKNLTCILHFVLHKKLAQKQESFPDFVWKAVPLFHSTTDIRNSFSSDFAKSPKSLRWQNSEVDWIALKHSFFLNRSQFNNFKRQPCCHIFLFFLYKLSFILELFK